MVDKLTGESFINTMLEQRNGTTRYHWTNELDGNIPASGYFDRIYGENHWNYLTIRSLAIGQGHLSTWPDRVIEWIKYIHP